MANPRDGIDPALAEQVLGPPDAAADPAADVLDPAVEEAKAAFIRALDEADAAEQAKRVVIPYDPEIMRRFGEQATRQQEEILREKTDLQHRMYIAIFPWWPAVAAKDLEGATARGNEEWTAMSGLPPLVQWSEWSDVSGGWLDWRRTLDWRRAGELAGYVGPGFDKATRDQIVSALIVRFRPATIPGGGQGCEGPAARVTGTPAEQAGDSDVWVPMTSLPGWPNECDTHRNKLAFLEKHKASVKTKMSGRRHLVHAGDWARCLSELSKEAFESLGPGAGPAPLTSELVDGAAERYAQIFAGKKARRGRE